MYLVIDRDYKISQTKILTGKLRAEAKKGNVSIVNITRMEGMNIDGSWSPIQDEPTTQPA